MKVILPLKMFSCFVLFHLSSSWEHVCPCVYMWVHVHAYVYVAICEHIYGCICTHEFLCVYAWVRGYVGVCVNMEVCKYTHVYMLS